MSYTSFDEKSDYQERCHRRHRASSDSKWSYKSTSSLSSEKSYDNLPPYTYSHVFYNSTADKPLPPLPLQGTRRVRFAEEKSLPSVPEGRQYRASSDSSTESAWSASTREKRPADREYEKKSRA